MITNSINIKTTQPLNRFVHVTENSKWYFIWSQFLFHNATNIHDIYNACLFRWTEYFIDYVMPLSRFIISCFGVNFSVDIRIKKNMIHFMSENRAICESTSEICLIYISLKCFARSVYTIEINAVVFAWKLIAVDQKEKYILTLSNECVLCAFCSDELKTVQNFHHLGNECWIRGKQCFNE